MRHTLTGWGYSKGCRCAFCTEAHRLHRIEFVKRRNKLLTLVDGRLVAPARVDGRPIRHGTTATYQSWLCRCEPCTEAQKEACRQWRARTTDKENAA